MLRSPPAPVGGTPAPRRRFSLASPNDQFVSRALAHVSLHRSSRHRPGNNLDEATFPPSVRNGVSQCEDHGAIAIEALQFRFAPPGPALLLPRTPTTANA